MFLVIQIAVTVIMLKLVIETSLERGLFIIVSWVVVLFFLKFVQQNQWFDLLFYI